MARISVQGIRIAPVLPAAVSTLSLDFRLMARVGEGESDIHFIAMLDKETCSHLFSLKSTGTEKKTTFRVTVRKTFSMNLISAFSSNFKFTRQSTMGPFLCI